MDQESTPPPSEENRWAENREQREQPAGAASALQVNSGQVGGDQSCLCLSALSQIQQGGTPGYSQLFTTLSPASPWEL